MPPFGASGYPYGFLRMTARTLSVYLRMFVNNGSTVLRPQSIAEIKTIVGGGMISIYDPAAATNSSTVLMPSITGLGWYWETMSDGRRYIGHSGSLPGMMHLMLVNERHNLGVIFLSNGDTIMATGSEPFETVKNIHSSLFECYKDGVAPGTAILSQGSLPLFSPSLLLVLLFLSL